MIICSIFLISFLFDIVLSFSDNCWKNSWLSTSTFIDSLSLVKEIIFLSIEAINPKSSSLNSSSVIIPPKTKFNNRLDCLLSSSFSSSNFFICFIFCSLICSTWLISVIVLLELKLIIWSNIDFSKLSESIDFLQHLSWLQI